MRDDTELLTYLTGDAAVTPLCVGDVVELRLRPRDRAMEAYSARGERLGQVPPAERDALADLLTLDVGRLRARIAALVPRPLGGGRIHIAVSAA